MYKIVLISRASDAHALDEAGRCLAMISQATGLDLDIELRDLDDRVANSSLALACLRADAVLVAGGSQSDPDREVLDRKLGLYAKLRPLHVAGSGEPVELLLVQPYRGRTPAEGAVEAKLLIQTAFVAAERRSKQVTIVEDPAAGLFCEPEAVANASKQFPEMSLETLDAEAAAVLIEARPNRFDVILVTAATADALMGAAGQAGLSPVSILAGDSGPFVFASDASDSRSAIAAAALLLRIAVDRPDLDTLLSGALEEALSTQEELGVQARTGLGDRVQSNLAERLGARNAHLQLMAMNRGCCG